MKKFESQPKTEKIEKIRIPDEDIGEWTRVLRGEGFSNKDIDSMLSHLNKEYARQSIAGTG